MDENLMVEFKERLKILAYIMLVMGAGFLLGVWFMVDLQRGK